MIIRKKLDAMHFLEIFSEIANFDDEKSKYYFIFADKFRGGQYTIMKQGDQWSIHGKGEDYCDPDETFIDEIDELVDFLWKHRGKLNLALKEVETVTLLV